MEMTIKFKDNVREKKLSHEVAKKVHLFCTQLAFTCSKLIIETLEQGVKYVQS